MRRRHPPPPLPHPGLPVGGARALALTPAPRAAQRENDARSLENGALPGYSFGHTSSEAPRRGRFQYLAHGVPGDPDGPFVPRPDGFTQPHIGNVGINEGDMECEKGCHLRGVVCRHLSETVSNYRSVETLDEYLKRQEVVGIAGVDTRQLTRQPRDTGSLVGVVCTDASKTDAEPEMASS